MLDAAPSPTGSPGIQLADWSWPLLHAPMLLGPLTLASILLIDSDLPQASDGRSHRRVRILFEPALTMLALGSIQVLIHRGWKDILPAELDIPTWIASTTTFILATTATYVIALVGPQVLRQQTRRLTGALSFRDGRSPADRGKDSISRMERFGPACTGGFTVAVLATCMRTNILLQGEVPLGYVYSWLGFWFAGGFVAGFAFAKLVLCMRELDRLTREDVVAPAVLHDARSAGKALARGAFATASILAVYLLSAALGSKAIEATLTGENALETTLTSRFRIVTFGIFTVAMIGHVVGQWQLAGLLRRGKDQVRRDLMEDRPETSDAFDRQVAGLAWLDSIPDWPISWKETAFVTGSTATYLVGILLEL